MDNLMKRTETLLREVVGHLERNRNSFGAEGGQEGEASQEGNSGGNSSNSSSTEASVEFRRRFPGMCSSRTTTQFTLPPKRQKMAGYVPAKAAFTPKDTWTHDFCALARQDENVTPSRARLNKLLDAGLGKARLAVQKNASHKELSTALENHFPKLKEAGGFEFLRADGGGGGQRQLALVYPSAFGYTVPHLRERFGQAVAYIRPLQTHLDESPLKQEVGLAPKVDCVNCGLSIPMALVRDHQQECRGGSSRGVVDRDDGPKVENFQECEVKEQQQGAQGEVTSTSTCTTSRKEPWMILNEVFPIHDLEQCKQAWESSGRDMSRAVAKLGRWIDDDSLEGDKELPIITGIWEEKQNDTDRVTNTDAGCSSGAVNTEDIAIEEDMNLTQLMKQQQKRYLKAGIQRINIARDTLWEDSVAIFKSSTFDPFKSPRIKFEDEEGIVAGGLRREYFTLLLKALANNPALFEGREDNKAITYNTSALQSNLFFLAGRMIACAIMHCDVGMPVFSRSMYYFLSHENVDMTEVPHHAEDLPDCEVVELIRKIENVENPESLEEIKSNSELSDLLQAAGWDKLLTYDNRAAAMQLLVAHEVLYKRKLCIDQFCNGLNVVGVIHLIRGYPELMLPFFVHNGDDELSPELLFGQFCNINHKGEGTNEVMRQHLKRAICQCYSEFGSSKLEEFLMFATGLSAVPPLGLDDKITITYRPDDCPYFFAETCTMELKVPSVHTDYGMFYKSFLEACQHSTAGFHCT